MNGLFKYLPVAGATIRTEISSLQVQENLQKATLIDSFGWNGGRWRDGSPAFVGRVGDSSFTVSKRGPLGNPFSPCARGQVLEQGGKAEVHVLLAPSTLGALFWSLGAVFLLAASVFVLVRAHQHGISGAGAFAPLIFLALIHIGGTIAFRLQSTSVIRELTDILLKDHSVKKLNRVSDGQSSG